MESFIYTDLNKACRTKDKREIECLGAFAAALSYIIHSANKRREDKLTGECTLYRGLKMSSKQVASYIVG